MKLAISRWAEDDLVHICGYIAARNPDAAERFRIEVEKAFRLLTAHPEVGPRPGWETRHSKLRFWVISQFNNFLIYCEADSGKISIERALDGRRDVRRIMDR